MEPHANIEQLLHQAYTLRLRAAAKPHFISEMMATVRAGDEVTVTVAGHGRVTLHGHSFHLKSDGISVLAYYQGEGVHYMFCIDWVKPDYARDLLGPECQIAAPLGCGYDPECREFILEAKTQATLSALASA